MHSNYKKTIAYVLLIAQMHTSCNNGQFSDIDGKGVHQSNCERPKHKHFGKSQGTNLEYTDLQTTEPLSQSSNQICIRHENLRNGLEQSRHVQVEQSPKSEPKKVPALERPKKPEHKPSVDKSLVEEKNKTIRGDDSGFKFFEGKAKPIKQPQYTYAKLFKNDPLIEELLSQTTIFFGNYKINFVPKGENWTAIVKEDLQGFSRTLELPVLYPIPQNNLNSQTPQTIENLLTANAAAQKHSVHVVLPEKSLAKYGFVYLGDRMGLMGGEWSWGIFGAVVGGLVVGIAMVAASVAAPALVIGWAAVAGASTGGAYGYLLGSGIDYWNAKNKKENDAAEEAYRRRCEEEERKRIYEENKRKANLNLDQDIRFANSLNDTVISAADSILSQVHYKSINTSLSGLKGLKSQLVGKMSVLIDCKYNEFTCHRASEIESCLERMRGREREIDAKIQEAKDKARAQARVVFEAHLSEIRQDNQAIAETIDDLLFKIDMCNLPESRANLSAFGQMSAEHIATMSAWENEQIMAYFPKDLAEVRGILASEKAAQQSRRGISEIIELAGQSKKNAIRLGKAMSGDLIRNCCKACKDGTLSSVRTLIEYKGISVNATNGRGNSLLHKAVKNKQYEVAEYLMQLKANNSISNERGKTPLDIAKGKHDPRMIEILQKKYKN